MADSDNTFLNADELYTEVEGETGKELNLEENQKQNLVGIVKSRFQQAEDSRQVDETRWIKSFENYRGLYISPSNLENLKNLVSL
jgi:DNA replication protein DnaD